MIIVTLSDGFLVKIKRVEKYKNTTNA